jgi:hypothetical protein
MSKLTFEVEERYKYGIIPIIFTRSLTIETTSMRLASEIAEFQFNIDVPRATLVGRTITQVQEETK